MSEYCDLLKLSELLNPKTDDNSDTENEEVDTTNIQAVGNEAVHDTDEESVKAGDQTNLISENLERNPDDETTFLFGKENAEGPDWRKCPEWNVSYRQQVTASDVFLQMGGKTPGTASCEDMVIQVHLPGENRQNIDLKITTQRLDLTSPQFHLDIPLPHEVDPQRGNAQWDSNESKLVITLRMIREYDYINF